MANLGAFGDPRERPQVQHGDDEGRPSAPNLLRSWGDAGGRPPAPNSLRLCGDEEASLLPQSRYAPAGAMRGSLLPGSRYAPAGAMRASLLPQGCYAPAGTRRVPESSGVPAPPRLSPFRCLEAAGARWRLPIPVPHMDAASTNAIRDDCAAPWSDLQSGHQVPEHCVEVPPAPTGKPHAG
jgi:hypothetical protein